MADIIKDKDLEGVNGGLTLKIDLDKSDENDYDVVYKKDGVPEREIDELTDAGNYTPGISLDNKEEY